MEVDEVVDRVMKRLREVTEEKDFTRRIPVGISNRHLHLSEEASQVLFGPGYTFVKMKDLSQPGQFACNETVTLVGPKGIIEKVRILGPVRDTTQIELLQSDCRRLGIPVVLRESGKLNDSPGLTLCGPQGCVAVAAGAIVAKRHIHMTPEDASGFEVQDGERVQVVCDGERGGVLHDVTVRVSPRYKLECHIDFEEANAMGMGDHSSVRMVKTSGSNK